MSALPPLPPGFTLDEQQQDIPALPPGFTLDARQPQQQEKPSMLTRALGAIGEPVLSLGSSAIAAPVAGLAGLAGTLLPGESGQGAEWTRRTQESMTYQPRTEEGAAVSGAIAYPFEKLAEGADIAGGAAAEATGSPAIGTVINTAIQTAPALLFRGGRGKMEPQRSPGRTEPTISEPPEVARARDYVARNTGLDWNSLSDSVKARITQIAQDAGSLNKLDPVALERQAKLESLPVPVRATRGQLTRDPVALTNEGNIAATETGAQVRAVRDAQSRDLIANLDFLKERTRGRGEKRSAAETPEDVGVSVQSALREKLKASEQQVKDLYKRAERDGEMQAPVSPKPIMDAIQASPDKTHLKWVQSWMEDLNLTKREKTGGIEVETTRKVTLKELEDLRQAAVARAMDGGTEGFYAGKVIRAIDDATEGAGGNAYKVARAARRQQALDFEDPVAVARLVENKSRTDRTTALEDTWRTSVIGGSIADLNQVKNRLLLDDKSGAGRRAWRDMRAETIEFIRRESTKGTQMLPDGTRPVSVAGMESALKAIGPQKLDAIFGKDTTKRLNAIMEATRLTRTEPQRIHPGSSTVGNALALMERSLFEQIPYVGSLVKDARASSAKRRQVEEAQSNPLKEAVDEAERAQLRSRQRAGTGTFLSLAPAPALGQGSQNRIRKLAGEDY
jgi:hypothetical protein